MTKPITLTQALTIKSQFVRRIAKHLLTSGLDQNKTVIISKTGFHSSLEIQKEEPWGIRYLVLREVPGQEHNYIMLYWNRKGCGLNYRTRSCPIEDEIIYSHLTNWVSEEGDFGE